MNETTLRATSPSVRSHQSYSKFLNNLNDSESRTVSIRSRDVGIMMIWVTMGVVAEARVGMVSVN